jgi:glycosyltransferase involved in cell wall biosynthesis
VTLSSPGGPGSSPEATVVVIGPLPPPVHGQSKNTELIATAASARAYVRIADTSPRLLNRSPLYYWRRVLSVGRVWSTLVRACTAPSRSCYIAMDSQLGLVPNLSYALLARALGFRLVLHHRTFGYVDSRSRLMDLVVKVAGASLHVFLCQAMERQFRSMYSPRRSLVVSNAATLSVPVLPVSEISDGRAASASPEGRVLNVGILGNLTFDKGLREFVEVVRVLNESGPTVGVLAGAIGGEEEAAYMDRVLETDPGIFRRLGPVDPMVRLAFLDEIDVFLFPTSYRFEAQPNVVFEAMARGVPVVATRMGCLASDVPESVGVTVPQGPDLILRLQQAVLIVRDEAFAQRRQNSVMYLEALKREAAAALSTLLDELTQSQPEEPGTGEGTGPRFSVLPRRKEKGRRAAG